MSEAHPNCMIGIGAGRVRSVVSLSDGRLLAETLSEWSANPECEEIICVPIDVARVFLFEPWPGLKAALAEIAGRSALAPEIKEPNRGEG